MRRTHMRCTLLGIGAGGNVNKCSHSIAQHSTAQLQQHAGLSQQLTAHHSTALRTDLGPAGALLVHVPDFVRSLTNGQILLHVAAVPAKLLQLHAQGVVLSHGVHGGASHLHDGLSPHQEVGPCNTCMLVWPCSSPCPKAFEVVAAVAVWTQGLSGSKMSVPTTIYNCLLEPSCCSQMW